MVCRGVKILRAANTDVPPAMAGGTSLSSSGYRLMAGALRGIIPRLAAIEGLQFRVVDNLVRGSGL